MEMPQFGVKYLPKILPIDFCQFFTHVLLRQADISPRSDNQVPTALAIMDHEVMFETLQERFWPIIEHFVGEELIPTYSYARLYNNGDTLERHSDRPACEVSVTLQLGRSHHYSWPIYMGGHRFDMTEGDAIIYKGCDIEHWRNVCDGPPGYYSGQVFFHYVKKNGAHAAEAGDSTTRNNYSYMRNRSSVMETK
jgi:hypothetical protein